MSTSPDPFELELKEEPSPFSATAPNQSGGPSSPDPNANALDRHADDAARDQQNSFGSNAEEEDPNQSPDLTRTPGSNFEDGT